MKERLIAKMIDYYRGCRTDVAHFLKVYAYAETIGLLEGLDSDTQRTLELTAIVRYDIFFRHVRVSDCNLIHQIIYIFEILKLFLSSDWS